MKDTLNDLISEKSVSDSRGVLSLVLVVLLKYGLAPLACIYFAWLITQKDDIIQKSNDTLVTIVREQTTATVINTSVLQGLDKTIKQIEDDRKSEKRNR